MKKEHILIMRFSAIGDVAMTVPVVYSLAHDYPNLRITVLSRHYARPFFENLAENINFMAADFNTEYKGIRGLNKLFTRLSAKHFTAVADFHDILRTKYLRLIFKLAGYRLASINKNRKGKKSLTRQRNKELKQQPTSFENYAAVLSKLGYPIDINFQSIYQNQSKDFTELTNLIGQKEQQWIGIAPFATHKGKIYPEEQMKKVLILSLEAFPTARIFLFGGGKHELEVMDQWAAISDRVVNASKLLGNLTKELALMSRLDVMVSMDSANMHLASLVGTKVISVWGATHPYAGFMGWNQSLDNAVQLDLPCRPCSVYGNKACLYGDNPCLNIKPEDILTKIKSIIDADK